MLMVMVMVVVIVMMMMIIIMSYDDYDIIGTFRSIYL